MDHDVRLQGQQGVLIVQLPLLHHPVHSFNIGKQRLSLSSGQQGKALVGGYRLIRQHPDSQPAQAGGPAENVHMPAVEYIGGEAHIDRPIFHLPELRANHRQILRGVDLGAEHMSHIQRGDAAGAIQGVQRVFRIACYLTVLAKGDNAV